MPSQSAEFKRNSKIILAGRPPCAACGKEMIFKGDLDIPRWWLHPMARTVDHVVPTVEGGSDALSNLRPMHRSCNSKRGNRQRRGPDHRRLRDFGSPRSVLYDATPSGF